MGPTCDILLSKKLCENQLIELDEYIRKISYGEIKADSYSYWSFYIADVGLFSVFISHDMGAYDEFELAQIKNNTGYIPSLIIEISAGVNNIYSHKYLATFASFILKEFGGYINFNGELNEKHPVEYGRLYNIYYSNLEGSYSYQIADYDFLSRWIEDPNFSMVK